MTVFVYKIIEEIKHIDGKWYVYSKKGKRLSKGYSTKEKAVKRLRQIEGHANN